MVIAYSNLKNKKKMILKSTTFNKKLFNIRQYRDYAIIIITLNYKLLNNLFIISETVIETVNALEILHFSRFYQIQKSKIFKNNAEKREIIEIKIVEDRNSTDL